MKRASAFRASGVMAGICALPLFACAPAQPAASPAPSDAKAEAAKAPGATAPGSTAPATLDASGEGVRLVAENPLAEARGPETLSVKLADLARILPSLDPARLVVADSASHEVISQLVDMDGDEAPDELVFQTSFGAKESKSFRLQAGERKHFRAEDYKVYGRFNRERHDDFAWENDRVAHRMYGADLETWKKEPLTSSGIDIWAKRARRLVINEWYMTDDYHRDNGDGADLYSVGPTRGCGGNGIWVGDKLSVSRNFVKSRVLAQGPLRLVFELEYPAFEAGGTKLSEVKRVVVDAGRNYDRFESRYKVEAGARPAEFAVGIAKHAGSTSGFERELGFLSTWEPLKDDNGHVGCGVVISPETVVDQKPLEKDYLLVAKLPPTGPAVYYAGAGWSKSGDFADQSAWVGYGQAFARALRAPLRVTVTSDTKRAELPPEASKSWASRTCDWIIARHPDGLGDTWEYDNGLVLRGCEQLGLKTGETKYLDYVKKSVSKLIADDGTIKGYKLDDYNIDNVNSGKLLFSLYARSTDAKERDKYTKALFLLRSQMKTQPRTSEGGFWHKKIYPNQMWLDGLYMGAPFLAQFAGTFNERPLFDDVAKQFLLLERHARDEKTGLLYHGWDESKQQRWANPKTGTSPEFWGRAVGWYAMGLVDTLEQLPKSHPKYAELVQVLNRLALALAAVQDKETGVWWQVLDKGGRPGNYREASGTAMFVYALSKGVRNGWLKRETFAPVAERGYSGLLSQFVGVDLAGNVEIKGICKVAGLGGNPYRDGSYDYYVSTDIASNDPKGLGSFILASVEQK